MSTCERCGAPKPEHADLWATCGDGPVTSDTYKLVIACRDRELALLRQKLAASERENKAWRGLAGVRALQHRGDDGYWFEAFGKPATIASHPTQQEAALASAVALGLLDKEGG